MNSATQPKTVIVVDDEIAARESLIEVLDTFENLKVVAQASNGVSAIQKIKTLQPDIVFLDIEMPEMNGFEVAKATQDLCYQLVFLTAYDQYALDAFDTDAIDYLLKPARPKHIEKSIHKIFKQIQMAQQNSTGELIDEAEGYLTSEAQRLTIRSAGEVLVFNYEHIGFIDTVGRYRRIHLTSDGQEVHKMQTYVCDVTFEELTQLLPQRLFLRVHRGFVINLQQLLNLKSSNGRYNAQLVCSEMDIPVSRAMVSALRNRL